MQYTVKVPLGKTVFLWGGEGITRTCEARLTLLLRVADGGEPVEIVSFVRASPTNWGTLQQGETFAIPLFDKTGVTAETVEDGVDSRVLCELHMDQQTVVKVEQ